MLLGAPSTANRAIDTQAVRFRRLPLDTPPFTNKAIDAHTAHIGEHRTRTAEDPAFRNTSEIYMEIT